MARVARGGRRATAARGERGMDGGGMWEVTGERGCLEPGCGRAADVASRYCRVHGDGEVARAERRATARLLGDLEGAALGGPEVGQERRSAELWRRAARGDYGELLEERLGEVMAAGEVGRVRGLLGQLVGALAISLDEVMTGEADPEVRSLAVSRLAHAATRVVATRRAEAADAAGVDKAKANRAFYEFLAEMDAGAGRPRAVAARSHHGGWGGAGGEEEAPGDAFQGGMEAPD